MSPLYRLGTVGLIVTATWTIACDSTSPAKAPPLDVTPPTVTLSVHDTITTSLEIAINGVATDDRGIRRMSAQLWASGTVVQDVPITFTQGTKTQFQVVVKPQITGELRLVVTASDTQTNAGRDSVSILLDRDPPLLWTVVPMFTPSSPALVAVYGLDNTTRNLHVTYAVNDGAEQQAGTLRALDGRSDLGGALWFGGAVSVQVPPGTSTLTIRARDDAGNTSSLSSFVISGPAPTAAAVAYDHECMLMPDGTAVCLGQNDYGQLGDGTTTARATPAPVVGGLRFSQMAAGLGTTCGVTTGGALYCWGVTTFAPYESSLAPKLMTGLPPVTTVAVGTSFICALTKTGTILCWGIGGDGQLGDGAMTNRATPAPIADNHVFANVLASNYTGCGLTGDGEAYCWGDNYYNERGDESYVAGGAKPPLAQPTPFHAAASHQFASLMVGYMQACGLQSNGQAICWGRGDYGRLGTGIGLGPTPPLPVQIPEPLQSVASPFETGCAIGISGQLYCYGSDERTLPGTTPLERGIMIPSPFIPWSEAWYIPPLPSMLGIRLKSILGGGFFHMCAISADGAIYCFGHPVGT